MKALISILRRRSAWVGGICDQAAMSRPQVPAAWSERGYVPPEQLEIKDDGDEKGEAAYMRCFHESSKIGRVPNASFFVNSPSARAYVEKRDKELFPVKEVSSTRIPNPDLPSWVSRKEGPRNHFSSGSESQSPASNAHATPPAKDANVQSPQEVRQQSQQISPSAPTATDKAPTQIPWSIEPQTGARGPPRMIR